MKLSPLVTATLLAGLLPATADYVVDVDLGTLALGDTSISGTTAQVPNPNAPPATIGGNNNSIWFQGLPLQTNTNWGNELVFQFTLAEPGIVSIVKTADFVNDPDFFLLDGLTTSVDPGTGKTSAENGIGFAFLDAAVGETTTLGALRDGTYYLTVENFDGFDGQVVPGDSTFTVRLNVVEVLAPTEIAQNLGPIAASDSPLSFDTFGSNYNTELAIYNLFGDLLFENDDAAGGQQSEIQIPGGLEAGSYYAAVAGNDVTFDIGPLITTGGAVGDYVLNYDLGPNIPAGQDTGTTTAGSEVRETQLFLFQISAPPVATALGTIANAGEQFEINLTGSGFDTEMAVYDSSGFVLFINDDFVGTASGVDFTEGLAAGTWYVAVIGYNGAFGDGFLTQPGTAGGSFVLNHPQGVENGALNSGETLWFSFDVAGTGPQVDPITITSLEYNPASNEFTVAWDSTLPGPFNIRFGSEGDLAGLGPVPNNLLPSIGAAGVTSPVTIPVPVALQGQTNVFLQVSE